MAKRKALAPPHLQAARADACERVADAVAAAMAGIGSAEISRRLGRDMGRTLWNLQEGTQDATITTLADIAHATGRRLIVQMVPVTTRPA